MSNLETFLVVGDRLRRHWGCGGGPGGVLVVTVVFLLGIFGRRRERRVRGVDMAAAPAAGAQKRARDLSDG